MSRKVKIICTIGPSSCSENVIEGLILSGMNIARLNFSHGDHSFYRSIINTIRTSSVRLNKQVAILQDLQGPKIRIGKIKDKVFLTKNSKVAVTTKVIVGDDKEFSSQYQNIIHDVNVGDRVLIDDGKIILLCENKDDSKIYCRVIQGGYLKSNKGINLPQSAMSTKSMTAKDLSDLHFGAHAGVDAVALSFVRTANDILQLRKELANTKSKPLLIAKLEKQQAIDDLENILMISDGVMVARGDLGVEIPVEKVPLVQKHIITKALEHGKPSIVATEMLESMIDQIRPTRAEASDVANAVLDGADMLMLSAETASGKHPIKVVSIMDRIINQVEDNDTHYYKTSKLISSSARAAIQNTIALNAVSVCRSLDASAIVMFSNTGTTARMVSAYRPKKPVIAFVPDIHVQRSLLFYWGINSEIVQPPERLDEFLSLINNRLLQLGYMVGEKIIVLTKIPLKSLEHTNTIHVHTVRPPAL